MDNPHEQVLREVDGMKVAFVEWGLYTQSMFTPSMVSTARATGADVTFLLAPDLKAEDVTDDEIRNLLKSVAQELNEEEQSD